MLALTAIDGHQHYSEQVAPANLRRCQTPMAWLVPQRCGRGGVKSRTVRFREGARPRSLTAASGRLLTAMLCYAAYAPLLPASGLLFPAGPLSFSTLR